MAEHFRIIGIRPIEPDYNHDGRIAHYEKVESIHKALYGKNDWLFFYKGITIDPDHRTVKLTKEALTDFSIYDLKTLKVSVSAIVGKNGSGKSSVVDLMIRIINNLSAAALGEGFNFATAEHLHFIDYVYGELCFQIGRIIYILENRGRNIKLYCYERHRNSGLVFELRVDEVIDVLDENLEVDVNEPLRKNPKGRNLLRKLFYTLVCNYSLYGFNYRDYQDEATPRERLDKIYGTTNVDKLSDEDKIWLKGIFHKNDGYQTPVVLHPMRNDGMLDIAKENELAKERLISLQFYQDKPGHYPFRTINGDLRIIAFKITPKKEKNFTREGQRMLERIGISRTRNVAKHFDQVYEAIIKFWAGIYNFDTQLALPERIDAYDYVVYKTLKIIFNYKKYQPIFNCLSRSEFEIGTLYKKLQPLSLDFSHVTKKLRRTIAYLKSSIYDTTAIYHNLEGLDKAIFLYDREFATEKGNRLTAMDLLPPPIFDVDLIMSKLPELNGCFKFSGLSSGERQLAYTISNCMYHLVNLNSSWDDLYRDKDHMAQIKYHYANVVFDEVELYYHPEMQRQFLHFLMEAISCVELKHLKGINIILATHSPFILSDIPLANILKLGDGGVHNDEETYGANIIDILGNSFFLDYTIGEEVRLKLQHIAELYQKRTEPGMISEYKAKRRVYSKVISFVGDEYLRNMMERMCKEMDLIKL